MPRRRRSIREGRQAVSPLFASCMRACASWEMRPVKGRKNKKPMGFGYATRLHSEGGAREADP